MLRMFRLLTPLVTLVLLADPEMKKVYLGV